MGQLSTQSIRMVGRNGAPWLMTTAQLTHSDSLVDEMLVIVALQEQRELDDAIEIYLDKLTAGATLAIPCCGEMLKTGRCRYSHGLRLTAMLSSADGMPGSIPCGQHVDDAGQLPLAP